MTHDKKQLLSIGEAAKALEVTRRMILNYEDKGLILPDQRDGINGNRYYTADTVSRIRSIRILQNLGLSLDDIYAYYHGTTDLEPLITRLEDLRDEISRNIEKLKEHSKEHNDFEIRQIELPAQTVYCQDLHSTELEDKKDVYVSQLSGGQKQRVGIARALTTTPDILLCDEATSALDPQTTEAILKLLKKINREMGVTILLITHQMQVVQMICNKVAVMEKGQVVEAGSVLDVFGKPQAPVTKRFVQTVVNDQVPESIISLVKEQKEHFRVERLKFIGSSVKRPVISDICHVEGIVVNILGATVQELQDNIMCVFILQLLGSEEKILKAEKQIDENGVIRERVEVI